MKRTYADGEEGDGLVDTSQRGNINGLTADSSLRANTGRVFTGTSVDNSIDENLNSEFNTRWRLDNEDKRTWMGFWSVKRWMISKA